jgi:hypothetical protein
VTAIHWSMGFPKFLLLAVTACSAILSTLGGEAMGAELVTETRDVGAFSGVHIAGRGKVAIARGEKPSLQIEATQETLDRITSEVENGVLVIRETQAGWGVRGTIRMSLTYVNLESLALSGSADVRTDRISAPEFELSISGSSDVNVEGLAVEKLSVEVRGSGDLEIEDLEGESVEVQVSGSGDVSARGTAPDQSVTVRGSGSVDTFALESRSTQARVSGSGNVELWVTETLDVTISGSGDISYRGDAKVTHDISGSGRLRRK